MDPSAAETGTAAPAPGGAAPPAQPEANPAPGSNTQAEGGANPPLAPDAAGQGGEERPSFPEKESNEHEEGQVREKGRAPKHRVFRPGDDAALPISRSDVVLGTEPPPS